MLPQRGNHCQERSLRRQTGRLMSQRRKKENEQRRNRILLPTLLICLKPRPYSAPGRSLLLVIRGELTAAEFRSEWRLTGEMFDDRMGRIKPRLLRNKAMARCDVLEPDIQLAMTLR